MIGHESCLSLKLIARLERVGFLVRVILDSRRPATFQGAHLPVSVEKFWGDLEDPMSIMIASEDAHIVIVDLASLSPDSSQEISQMSRPNQLPITQPWRGTQQFVGEAFRRLLGTYKDPAQPPMIHSSILKQTTYPVKTESEKTLSLLEKFPLFEGLSLCGSSTFKHQQFEHNQVVERPLILISPSLIASSTASPILGDQALASYQLAGWSPRILCYDWVIDHFGQRYSDQLQADLPLENSAKKPSPFKGDCAGDLSDTILSLLYYLCGLRLSKPKVFASFLEGHLSLKHLDQSLSSVGVADLVSATLILIHLEDGDTRHQLSGGVLTWRSLTQLCAHLIDELSPPLISEVRSRLAPLLHIFERGKEHKSLHRLTRALRKQSFKGKEPLAALNLTITKLIARSDGGADQRRDEALFSSLSHRFTPKPITIVLGQELRALISHLSQS